MLCFSSIKTLQKIEKVTLSHKRKYACSICTKSVANNLKALQCDSCDLCAHIKCDGTSAKEYSSLMEEYTRLVAESKPNDATWHCLKCRIMSNYEMFAVTLCDNAKQDFVLIFLGHDGCVQSIKY